MDRISGFVVISLGIAILWQGRDLSIGSLGAAGPGFFPTLIALALIILSLFLIIPEEKKGKQERQPVSTRSVGRVLATFVALLFYFLFLETLGFVITSFLLLVFLFVACAYRRWHSAVFAASLITGVIYVMFEILLKSDLPKGALGF